MKGYRISTHFITLKSLFCKLKHLVKFTTNQKHKITKTFKMQFNL